MIPSTECLDKVASSHIRITKYVASRLSDAIIQQIDLTDTPGHV